MAASLSNNQHRHTARKKYSPFVNLVQKLVSATLTMNFLQILLNPLHKVVLETPFDNLVQQIRHHHLIDVCAWELESEGL
jgi:hypothetical protein